MIYKSDWIKVSFHKKIIIAVLTVLLVGCGKEQLPDENNNEENPTDVTEFKEFSVMSFYGGFWPSDHWPVKMSLVPVAQ